MALGNVKLHLIDSVDSAHELLRWLSNKDIIACDTEGTGLNVQKDLVRLVQVGDAQHGWAIPWERWGGVFEELVSKYTGEYIFHNVKYDIPMLDRAGVKLPRHKCHDTRIMAHILDSTGSTALKNLAAKHVDPLAAHAQGKLDEAIGTGGGWTWATVPVTFGPYWQYAALDCVLTYELRNVLYPLVMAEAPKSYELELAVTWVIERMERYGVHVDVPHAVSEQTRIDAFCKSVEEWCKKEYNVSPGSNQAVIQVLQDEGYDFTKRTPGGALSLDGDVLEHITHPLAEAVLQRRQLLKVSSTFLNPFTHDADENSLIHPSINVLGARTSRMSMQKPNLQNLPRHNENNPAGNIVRNCVTSRYGPNGLLMMCDYDQIEMRLLAHHSGDQGLIDAFVSEGDFFINLAQQIFNDPTIEKKDPRRQLTKNASYAKIYCAGIAKFAATAGVPQEQARSFLARFDSLFPGVRHFQGTIQRTSMHRKHTEGIPYVRSTMTGRKHIADSGQEYALVNYLLQGTAAEVYKMGLLELDAAGVGDYMMLPVHDEILLDVPDQEAARDTAEILLKVMNNNSLLTVPLTASVSCGERWGQKRTWSDEA